MKGSLKGSVLNIDTSGWGEGWTDAWIAARCSPRGLIPSPPASALAFWRAATTCGSPACRICGCSVLMESAKRCSTASASTSFPVGMICTDFVLVPMAGSTGNCLRRTCAMGLANRQRGSRWESALSSKSRPVIRLRRITRIRPETCAGRGEKL